MQKVFDEVNTLDNICYDRYGLSQEILMENASRSMYEYIKSNFDTTQSILIISGSGNNGADGIALARMLHNEYQVSLYLPLGTKSKLNQYQLNIAKLIGVHIVQDICNCDVLVDALFGTGLTKDIDDETIILINRMNSLKAYKIACDIPSGIYTNGDVKNVAFKANTTITMGALKKALFLDQAKDYVQDIIVANLGVSQNIYQNEDTNCYLLEKNDMHLPLRDTLDTHKGSFGHLATILGHKEGAGIICALSSFSFGVGLSTVVCYDKIHSLPYELMHSNTIPKNTTAIAVGMGLGECESSLLKDYLSHNIPYIIDADMFHRKEILTMLQKEVVLTPHPKEFVSLLNLTSIAHIDIGTLQNDRFKYIEAFSNKYPNVVLLLKGANTIIAHNHKIYINTFGTSALSFGGSGDVLSGMIGALLAQGYDRLDATISASLAHTISIQNSTLNNYALTPIDLIQAIKVIK